MLADVLELKYDAELAEVEARHEARHEARLMEEKRTMARIMKREGDSTSKIVRVTGLSESEVESL